MQEQVVLSGRLAAFRRTFLPGLALVLCALTSAEARTWDDPPKGPADSPPAVASGQVEPTQQPQPQQPAPPSVGPSAPPGAVPPAAGPPGSPPAPSPSAVASAESQKLSQDLYVACLYIADGRFDEACFRAQEQMDRFGENGKARFVLGLAYHKQKRYDLARPQFERAIELEPGYYATYNFYGYCMLNLGELDGARNAFMKHLSFMPEWADSHFGLGLVDLEEDLLDDAAARFKKAIELDKAEIEKKPSRHDLKADLAKAHTRLADVYLRRDDLQQAKAELVLATDLWPNHYEAWAKLHRVLKRLGEDEAAEAALKKHDEVLQRLHPRTRIEAPASSEPASPGMLSGAVDDNAPTASIHFTDVTAESGINFVMTSGSTPSTQILEVKGGGLALIDFDNDGDLDLFIPNGATLDHPDSGPGCRLFENLGGLKFRDVTAASGINFHRWGMGVAVGDYDGDGLDDIFIACFGSNALLRNLGGGKFAETTNTAGLADDRGPQSPSGRDWGGPRWSAGAAFGDIDNDGDLDLYVANYLQFDPAHPPPKTRFLGTEVFGGPQGLTPQSDFLYENLGNGTFRDISESSGCLTVPPSFGLGVVILDYDGDGLQDIFVGNDSMKNFLFHNLGAGRFKNVADDAGIATNAEGSEQATMGIAIGDVDGNGRPDVFTTNFSDDTNTLHLNLDGRFFDDRTQQYGLGVVSRPFLGWATMFFDLDHDGDEDLLVFNGHVYPSATRQSMNSDYRQVPLLFERFGPRFRRVTGPDSGPWLSEPHCDRSAVFGDLDNDGDIDVIISELNGPVRVLRNDAVGGSGSGSVSGGGGGHWLIVELKDARPGIGNRHGLGAKIELTASPGATGPKQTRWLFSGGSFQSACAPYAHFGLGSAGVVTLEITWPGGVRQRLEQVAIDQHLTVTRP